jgi:hypothetical protein
MNVSAATPTLSEADFEIAKTVWFERHGDPEADYLFPG